MEVTVYRDRHRFFAYLKRLESPQKGSISGFALHGFCYLLQFTPDLKVLGFITISTYKYEKKKPRDSIVWLGILFPGILFHFRLIARKNNRMSVFFYARHNLLLVACDWDLINPPHSPFGLTYIFTVSVFIAQRLRHSICSVVTVVTKSLSCHRDHIPWDNIIDSGLLKKEKNIFPQNHN